MADAPSDASVVLEHFQPPRVKYVNQNDYPYAEIQKYGEGWVNLGFMVDPKGKPFEITVLASTGNKTFEQEAVRTLEHATFDPPDGSWSLELFKRHFRVEVSEGHVSVIKLRCSKHYVSFVLDPNLDYEVKTGFGSCRMEMLGDPGTKFTLSQF
jgi:TonB family protein